MKHIISIILFYVLFYNMKVSHIYVVAQIKEYKAKVWAEVHPLGFSAEVSSGSLFILQAESALLAVRRAAGTTDITYKPSHMTTWTSVSPS